MFTDDPSKRLLVSFLIAATNIFSFAFGITLAGERRTSVTDPVAASAIAKTPSPAAKPAVKPSAKAAAPAAPAAAQALAPLKNDVGQPTHVVTSQAPIAGKGFWIYEFDKVAKGNVHEIVKWARQHDLSHLYVRAGTSRSGLNTWPDVARILPVAHAAGLKVIPWFFPYLSDPDLDAARTVAVLQSVVKGHKVDGFAADIETPAEGTRLSAKRVKHYVNAVRAKAPNSYLILVPPRPTRANIHRYPFELVPRFDAVAPMVYWGRVDPMAATADAVSYLKRFGRPIAPIGQAYDMGPEGGPKGRPKPGTIGRFMTEALNRGSIGVSFWSWQHSSREQWAGIKSFRWAR
jgi:hypothetical protein